MKQAMHCLSISWLVLGVAAGCSTPSDVAESPAETANQSSRLIVSEDCMAGSQDGKVGICHRNDTEPYAYTHIRVSTNACIAGHASHSGDFVSDDPTCPVCGNGVVENGEICDPIASCPSSCDDGNACTVDAMAGSPATCNAVCSHVAQTACQSGDGCCPAGCDGNSDTDCPPVCTPKPVLQQLTFNWLGRACTQPADVVFWINNAKTGNQDREIARIPLASSCDCSPGVATFTVTDPTLLSLGVNAANIFRVTTTGELSWATVFVQTPTFAIEPAIWAAWPLSQGWPNHENHPSNMCESGMQSGLTLSGVGFMLSGGVDCGG